MQSSSLKATILYNYSAVHALPVAANLLTSAWLRMAEPVAKIGAAVWPWPEPELFDKRKSLAARMMMDVIAIAFMFAVPTFAIEIVRDRTVCYHTCWTEVRHTEYMSSCKATEITNTLGDFIFLPKLSFKLRFKRKFKLNPKI